FGVMRAREFIMKDAYSFHVSQESLQETYEVMREAYGRIFSRLGLDFRAVQADSGAIGGRISHEFHVLADSGEDAIAFSGDGAYAANLEMAVALPPAGPRPEPSEALDKVATPGQESITDVSAFLGVQPSQCVKTLLVKGNESDVVALVVRGDHELNPVKAGKLPEIATPLTFAEPEQILAAAGSPAGSIGPVGLDIPVIADHGAAHVADFVCGANEEGWHYRGVNWGRDLPEPRVADIRNVVEGDPNPEGEGTLSIRRGIEVGHIFQLGTKYSEAMNTTCLDENGRAVTLIMGCYGIGVSRIAAAAIEQHHDDKGIVWPDAMAPFDVMLIPLNMHKSRRLREAVEKLYDELRAAGISVLLDDRKERPGVMFADHDLIGIPHRLVLGERGLDAGSIEYKSRREDGTEEVPLENVTRFLKSRLGATE
ncbi:MAG TPA: proline--tRNA ligase, partial [Chromatiales bacterium]|nr:proline--tRNA ligase [Chromatiales bacterium]